MLQARKNFEVIAKKYANLKEKPRLTESTLLLLATIQTDKSVYTFDPLENAAQQNADEIRLNINDEFIATHVGVYLFGTLEDAAAASTTKVMITKFPNEYLAAGQSLKANNLYRGQLAVSVNNVKYVEKYDLRRFNKAGQGYLTTESLSSFDMAEDGMQAIQPMFTLSGAKKNEIQIAVPEALAGFEFPINGATQNMKVTIDKIALRLFGLNAQNGAKFQS